MNIRWKLLVVMLSMILVPIVLLHWNAQSGMQEMGDELAATTRNAMIQKAREELQIIVDEHSTVLQRERELIEMVLQFQASKLEKWLADNKKEVVEPTRGMQPVVAQKPNTAPPATRSKLMGNGQLQSFAVFYDRVSYRIAERRHGHFAAASNHMPPIYRQLFEEHPDLVFWQITIFEDRLQTLYPGVNRLPMQFEPTKTDWYRIAREKDGMVWGRPTADPFTGRFQLTVAMRFQNPNNKLFGVTAIAVPVGELLQNHKHFDYVSKRLKPLLVDIKTAISDDRKGIRILAAPRTKSKSRDRWWASRTNERINIGDEIILKKFAADLESHQSNVLNTMVDGVDSLLAYSDIDKRGTALVLIVPKEDIMVEALAMEDKVLDRIDRQIRFTGLVLILVMIVVVGLAFFLSRSITGNIRKLVDASRRIAEGDFSTRADIHSNDEMGELGRTFDRMVPALEENLKIKQSLDLAMEVQQSLLPAKTPDIDGLDIAAISIYCDETGGDFYDFPAVGCNDNHRLGIAVGDVAGHGVSAALLMASARAFLRCRISQPGEKSKIISDVNALLTSDTDGTGQFVTLFYADIDVNRRKIEWIRAGHDPALLYNPIDDKFDELAGQGAAMGIDNQLDFSVNSLEDLSPGQILCIGTDGIWETHNTQGEMFGRKRLRDIIRQKSHLPAEKIVADVIDCVREFRAGSRQEDDITLVIVKLTSTKMEA